MKKMILTLIAMLTFTLSASGMSYEQARNEALFLTDKMAYELNLTDEQYEAAYEINLDYLMGVTGRDDVFGVYWERRNLDLSYILLDWQWQAYMAATYFYRPLYWEAGYWHFGVYRRYPHRDYFYFGRPHFYATYRGGHAWHLHGSHGYYYVHRTHFRSPRQTHFGMHDRWTRGDFRSPRQSSTRITSGSYHRGIDNSRRSSLENRRIGNHSSSGNFHGSRSNGTYENSRSGSYGENRNGSYRNRSESYGNRNGSYGSNRSSSYGNSRSGSYDNSRSGSFSGSRSGSFSGSRSAGSTPSRSIGGSSMPSRSSSAPTRSFGSGSGSGSHGGGSHYGGSNGGGNLGGHR